MYNIYIYIYIYIYCTLSAHVLVCIKVFFRLLTLERYEVPAARTSRRRTSSSSAFQDYSRSISVLYMLLYIIICVYFIYIYDV